MLSCGYSPSYLLFCRYVWTYASKQANRDEWFIYRGAISLPDKHISPLSCHGLPQGGTVHSTSLLVTNISITLSKGENALLPKECVGCSLQVTGWSRSIPDWPILTQACTSSFTMPLYLPEHWNLVFLINQPIQRMQYMAKLRPVLQKVARWCEKHNFSSCAHFNQLYDHDISSWASSVEVKYSSIN